MGKRKWQSSNRYAKSPSGPSVASQIVESDEENSVSLENMKRKLKQSASHASDFDVPLPKQINVKGQLQGWTDDGFNGKMPYVKSKIVALYEAKINDDNDDSGSASEMYETPKVVMSVLGTKKTPSHLFPNQNGQGHEEKANLKDHGSEGNDLQIQSPKDIEFQMTDEGQSQSNIIQNIEMHHQTSDLSNKSTA